MEDDDILRPIEYWSRVPPYGIAGLLRVRRINHNYGDGCRPLHWAARRTPFPEVIMILLSVEDVDAALINDAGETPYDCAQGNPALANTEALIALGKASGQIAIPNN